MPILDWLNRDKDVRAADCVPYRLLHSVDELSYGDPASPNMLIQGDNLEALKALLPYYSGKVNFIYIDPPYNTGNAFAHYDDNLEHSLWLSLMYPRLTLLRELLAEGGFICCQIDDSESHYLKVLMDEVFGRNIEIGDHAETHCQPRLKKVVDGEQGGISEAVGWTGGGGFRYYKLGSTIFDTDGDINPDIRFPHLAAHIWFCETKTAYHPPKKKSPLLGIHNGVAYYLLYNGILGDKSVSGGNVLTNPLLNSLPPHEGAKVIYGETSRITQERLRTLNIIFKQTPYDVKAK